MLNRLFPRVIDNSYRGHWLGLVLFGAVAAILALQGGESWFNTRETMARTDGGAQ